MKKKSMIKITLLSCFWSFLISPEDKNEGNKVYFLKGKFFGWGDSLCYLCRYYQSGSSVLVMLMLSLLIALK